MCESDYWSFEQQRLLADLVELVSPDQQPHAVKILRQVEEIGSSGRSSDDLASELNFFLRQADVGIWQWDVASNQIMLSESWCQRLGLDPEKNSHSLDDWKACLYPGDYVCIEEAMTKAVGTEPSIYEIQHRMRHVDGRWRWLLSKGVVVTDANGKPVGLKGIYIDITEAKEAMRSLRFSQIALDEANSKIFWIDPSGRFIYVNNQAVEWLGVSREAAEQMTVFDHTEFTEETWAEYVEMMRTNRTATFECMVHSHDTNRPVEVHATLVSYEGEEVLVSVLMDISDRLASEADRESQSKNLMHVARLTTMGEMSATLSHELAQPISAIGNYANSALHLLQNPNLDNSSLKTILSEIVEQSERTVQILRHVRKFTKHKELSKQHCILDEIVTDSLAMMRHDLANNSVEVSSNLNSGSVNVFVDRVHLQQVIINLLQNARDAMEDMAKEARRIQVSTDIEDKTVVLSIHDSGTGIPDGEDEKLFRMFYTTKSNGAGIGLAICRSIVDSHDGELVGRNNDTGGAIFSVRLPIASPVL